MQAPMRGFVAPTDHGWYQFLLGRAELSEVNFWRPGAGNFLALRPGEPFFFKLKAPYNAIGGFGLFARFARLPVWRAWDVFGHANGTSDEYDLLRRLHRLGGRQDLPRDLNRVIGCIAVSETVFFPPDEWVRTPPTGPRQSSPVARTTWTAAKDSGYGAIVLSAPRAGAALRSGRATRGRPSGVVSPS